MSVIAFCGLPFTVTSVVSAYLCAATPQINTTQVNTGLRGSAAEACARAYARLPCRGPHPPPLQAAPEGRCVNTIDLAPKPNPQHT